MYVCICKAVTEREIRSCLSEGADSMEGLQDRLGVATCCGRCRCEVERVLGEHCLGCRDSCAGRA
jgi:bacterioferritin-associated ferredoxin